jgi:hypothetical protein
LKAYPRERFSSEVALSPEIVVEFANAAGDNNPIHHDAVFAATTPYCPTSRSTVLRGFLWLLLTVTGWLDRREREALAYLIEENRLLRRQVGGRRLRFTDDERRRLAIRAHAVGRKALRELATIITPDTLLQWHRQLVAPSGPVRGNTLAAAVFLPRSVNSWCAWPRRIRRGAPMRALGVKAPSFRREICTPSPLPLKRTPREQDPSASVVVTLPIAPAP